VTPGETVLDWEKVFGERVAFLIRLDAHRSTSHARSGQSSHCRRSDQRPHRQHSAHLGQRQVDFLQGGFARSQGVTRAAMHGMDIVFHPCRGPWRTRLTLIYIKRDPLPISFLDDWFLRRP